MATKAWPLDRGFVVTSDFGDRWGTKHWGTDFGFPGGSAGRNVYAAQGGTVVQAGAASGFGRWVLIDHPTEDGGGTTVYGHVVPLVTAGQRVEAGQLVARVNGDRQTNGGVDPHLHFEWHRYVWAPVRPDGTAPDRLDPMVMLRGAVYVDELGNPPAPTPEEKNVTLFGVDISNHQRGLDIARVKAEDFRAVIAKVSESDNFRDGLWPGFRDKARELGLPLMGYHYLRGGDVNRQADLFVYHLGDRAIPAMVDVEVGTPNIEHVRAFIRAVEARGVRVALVYLPQWFWRDHIGSPDLSGLPPIMSSDYGPSRTGFASTIYPGDNDRGWNNYGGGNVEVFQFTEKAVVAGQLIDAWAVKSQETLDRLFRRSDAPAPAPQPPAPEGPDTSFPYGPRPAPTGDRTADLVIGYLFDVLMPVVADVKAIRYQLTGSENAVYVDGILDVEKSFPGLEMLGYRTVPDILGALGKVEDIRGAFDPKP